MPTGGKKDWQKFFGSRWFLVILLLVAIFTAVAYGRAYYRDYQIRKEIIDLQNEVKKLEAKKIETMEVLQYVKSTNFIEEKARTELNLVKPGEKMIIITSGTQSNDSSSFKNWDYKQDVPNPVKWWRFFFGDLRS